MLRQHALKAVQKFCKVPKQVQRPIESTTSSVILEVQVDTKVQYPCFHRNLSEDVVDTLQTRYTALPRVCGE
jgi:hypothetical protein